MSDPDLSAPLTWAQFKACWQELDRHVASGEVTADEAVRLAYEVGLVRPKDAPHLPHEIREVMSFYPDYFPGPPYGPWLIVAFADVALGRTYLYRPVR